MNEGPRNGAPDWLTDEWDFVDNMDGWDLWRIRHKDAQPNRCDVVMIPAEGPKYWRGTHNEGRFVAYNSRESEPHVPEAVLNVALALRSLIQ